MNNITHLEHRASNSLRKHEGESSFALCDRLDRTRVNSQRQLPTDHDYAVPTREYQTDQSSLKSAQAAARSVLGERQKQRQLQKQPHRFRKVDTVTPYQAKSLIEPNAIPCAVQHFRVPEEAILLLIDPNGEDEALSFQTYYKTSSNSPPASERDEKGRTE